MRQDRRGSWYLLTGVVVGIVFGLFYSWVISPVEYVDAPPYALRADFKDEYRLLVAAAYLFSNDVLRAENRLAQLRDDNTAQSLARQAQQALAEGHPEAEVKALGLLAMALGKGVTPPPENATPTPTSNINMPSIYSSQTVPVVADNSPIFSTLQQGATQDTVASTQQPIITPQPTYMPSATLTATLGAPFILQESRLVCNPDQTQALIQVEVLDAAGQPIPSIELVAEWEGGEDHFFTGLQPELGLGYADFTMTPGVIYSLRLVDGGQRVDDLTPAECLMEDGNRFWGSWLITFAQP